MAGLAGEKKSGLFDNEYFSHYIFGEHDRRSFPVESSWRVALILEDGVVTDYRVKVWLAGP
jgi:hypothetical protein